MTAAFVKMIFFLLVVMFGAGFLVSLLRGQIRSRKGARPPWDSTPKEADQESKV